MKQLTENLKGMMQQIASFNMDIKKQSKVLEEKIEVAKNRLAAPELVFETCKKCFGSGTTSSRGGYGGGETHEYSCDYCKGYGGFLVEHGALVNYIRDYSLGDLRVSDIVAFADKKRNCYYLEDFKELTEIASNLSNLKSDMQQIKNTVNKIEHLLDVKLEYRDGEVICV